MPRQSRFIYLAVATASALMACNNDTMAPKISPATAAKPSLSVAGDNAGLPYLNQARIGQNDTAGSCAQGCVDWWSWGTGGDGLPGQDGVPRAFWILGTDSTGAIANPQYLIGGSYFNHYDIPLTTQLPLGHTDYTILFATGYPRGPGAWIPATVDVYMNAPNSTKLVHLRVGQVHVGTVSGPAADTEIVGNAQVILAFQGFTQPNLNQGGVDRVTGCCSIPDGSPDGIAHVSFDVSMLGNTSTGSNVSVQPTDATGAPAPVTLTFSNVTSTGSTTVTSVANGAPPPDGYRLSGSLHEVFDVSTTATFSGPVTLCFSYAGGGTPHLQHYVNGAWVDITTGYPSPGVVCGTTTSFSPFALFDQVAPTVASTVTGTHGTNGWYTSDVSVSWTVTPSFAVPTGCGPATVGANTPGQIITCSATTEGGTATQSDTIKRDASPPAIAYDGATSYTVDQNVALTCTVTAGVSGVTSQSCPGASGPAYTFALGATTLNASATSGAGLTATASTTLTVSVTAASLSALVQRWTDDAGVANSLVVKLQQGGVQAFTNEVNAQAGKHIPSVANAAILIRLAGSL